MTEASLPRPTHVAIIAAVADTGVIGRDNDLPWRMSDDLRRFKRLTLGHPVIMGRRTFESMGSPLPGRHNIVLSRDPEFAATDVQVCASLPEALAAVADAEVVFILGGSQIFAAAFEFADRLYLTRVHADIEGDTHFPEFDLAEWDLEGSSRHEADERNQYDYSFEDYVRA